MFTFDKQMINYMKYEALMVTEILMLVFWIAIINIMPISSGQKAEHFSEMVVLPTSTHGVKTQDKHQQLKKYSFTFFSSV